MLPKCLMHRLLNGFDRSISPSFRTWTSVDGGVGRERNLVLLVGAEFRLLHKRQVCRIRR